MSGVPRAVEWVGGRDGCLRLLDQTRLPTDVVYRDCRSIEDVWEAIRSLRVRGAPAIGVAAAYGVVIGVQRFASERAEIGKRVRMATEYLRTSRPPAVNLLWAI